MKFELHAKFRLPNHSGQPILIETTTIIKVLPKYIKIYLETADTTVIEKQLKQIQDQQKCTIKFVKIKLLFTEIHVCLLFLSKETLKPTLAIVYFRWNISRQK